MNDNSWGCWLGTAVSSFMGNSVTKEETEKEESFDEDEEDFPTRNHSHWRSSNFESLLDSPSISRY